MNKIVTENSQAGAPASEWDILGTDDGSIEGFATEMSINLGETVHFKVNTAATAYRLDIYRMGFYAGNGARKVATTRPSVGLPQFQPPGLSSPAGILDCGNWAVSASWPVPTDAVPGIYFAKLVREDGSPGASHIFFVVRDDDSDSDLLFQTSDTTWQAYNNYGESCLYEFLTASQKRASKVSYNRPFRTRFAELGANWVFNAEYPMVRWLEANGYDVSYCSGVDTDRFGDNILRHKVFLSVGHDEYWSAQQRANVEAARDTGVHLAFLSGNEVFWKTRWEESIDGSKTPYRTLVCYKDPHANTPIDPTGVWTGTWRDRRFSPPADGGRPENALTGTIFAVFGFTDNAISVPAEEGKLRFWRNTTMANLAPGAKDSVTIGTLGYEWDVDVDNGFRPAGLIRLSSTVISTDNFWFDNDSTGPATATHHLTLYRHKSGALVFGAGTVQWSWGLDNHHDARGNDPSAPDLCVQQAMVNLFADMGVQPASLQPDLVPESASTDKTAPTSSISFPSHGDILQPGQPINIQNSIIGSATDIDGKVAAVEVSVDGGLTWHPAVGRESWSYPWTPSGNGLITILSRAVDDSGNLEVPSAGIDVIVGAAVEEGPGGPILIIVNGSYSQKNPFGNYLGEILRAEGLVAFKTTELNLLMREADPLSFLNTFKLVLLAETLLLPDQLLLMRDYVSGGGNLIAMRPDPALADLFGLSLAGHRPEQLGQPQFFAFETSVGPGIGIESGPLQYHGDADNYDLAGATGIAHLWQSIGVPSVSPAVTVNTFGSGTAAAFAFDLAKSIVLMRQGNREWQDSEGDANPSYRPTDMFARLDGRIWFAPELLHIVQADEQQRFFANLVLTLIGQPLPRLWYLPSKHKTLIVNTGDGEEYTPTVLKKVIDAAASHGSSFTTYLRRRQIDNTSDPSIILPSATEASLRAAGHEFGVHVHNDDVETFPALHNAYRDITTALQAKFGHGARTARSHTIDWVGWVDMAKIEAEFGTRLDLNYYHYWPFSAVAVNPRLKLPTDKTKAHGYFTGSGLPQKFCDENGVILPIYQLLTEWPDEFFADNSYSANDTFQIIESMLEAAEKGFYSAFVANIHHGRFAGDDPITGIWAHTMWDYAVSNGIPMLSAEKLLDFVEARRAATLDNIAWDGTHLTFDFNTPTMDQDVTLMTPDQGLLSVTVDGVSVGITNETIKGHSYALFTTGSMSSHVVVSYGPT